MYDAARIRTRASRFRSERSNHYAIGTGITLSGPVLRYRDRYYAIGIIDQRLTYAYRSLSRCQHTLYTFLLLFTPVFAVKHPLVISLYNLIIETSEQWSHAGPHHWVTLTTMGSQFCYTKMKFILYKLFI